MTEGRKTLGQILLEQKLITEEKLNQALRVQKESEEPLGEILINQGGVAEEAVLKALSIQLDIPFVKISTLKIDANVIKILPAKVATFFNVIPIDMDDDILTVAFNNPLDIEATDEIKLIVKKDIKLVLSTHADIREAIRRYYGVGAATVEHMVSEVAETFEVIDETGTAGEDIQDETLDPSVVKFVNQILSQAINDRATDVHIEPFDDELRIRYRVDGLLYNMAVPQNIRHFYSAIISRIKIMSDLNIAEKRLPQDGRIKIKRGDAVYDLRISILPTPFGESIDIRILTSTSVFLALSQLGLSDASLKILNKVIIRPHGIILVTGPTGSGKTTTLYACLSKLNSTATKIITIEDPIEYQQKGITQIQVLPKIGLTFANGLRSMLRHDPDIMMVGEVRDLETAELAIRTALTGHLVFSTLHTNDASGAMTRLLDMGIEPYLVASSVICVIAQRLVRIICPDCKEKVHAKHEIFQNKEIVLPDTDFDIYRGRGCDLCKHTGFKGRTGIFEMLEINDEMIELINERVSANIIKQKAIVQGMKTLRIDGWDKVIKGITTPEEVLRVTQDEK
ncbi:MAG: ATPase, T2SS/T4P/T4SS family [Candidatus Omnitrophota bacterium]